MKKYLIIFLMTITLGSIAYSEIEELPEEPPAKWYKLTDYEKYQYYYLEHKEVIALEKALQSSNELLTTTSEVIEQNIEIEQKIKNYLWTPKFGMSLTAFGGFNQDLRADVFTSLSAKILFMKGRISIDPGLYVKIYDNLGGGLSLGFSLLF